MKGLKKAGLSTPSHADPAGHVANRSGIGDNGAAMWITSLHHTLACSLALIASILLAANGARAANTEGGGAFAPAKQKKAKTPGKKPSTSKSKTRKKPSGGSVSGRWRLVSNCNTGKFVIMLNLRQASPTTFSGTTHTISGSTKGTRTKLYGGKISGNRVSYTRGSSWKTYARGTISSNRRRMSGSETGAVWKCKFVATKR